MIHLKTVVSLLAVLIAVVPVTPVEKVPVPDDPESLPVDGPGAADGPAAMAAADGPIPTAGGQGAQPRWLRCAKRCQKHCLGMRNEKRCATNFVAQHCFPFGKKVGGVVVAKCQEAIECQHNGMKLCPDTLQCLLQDQCCVGCHSNYRCMNHWCAAKGSPSFTLTWTGYGTFPRHEYLSRNGSPILTRGVLFASTDDLDLNLTTPYGDELSYAIQYDANSGGRFQHDDIPDRNTSWQETVYFPLDRSAPEGTYEFFVYNNHNVPDPARPYAITIFDGEQRIATKRGTVENGFESAHYTYYFVP
jgi:hypothetical protein